MAELWVGFSDREHSGALERCLARTRPGSRLVRARSADGLRLMLRNEEPRTVGAIVGPCPAGVSDVNLAAALVADGRARAVVLAAVEASGSLRSRALRAGITQVVDFQPDELASADAAFELPVLPPGPCEGEAWLPADAGPAQAGRALPGEARSPVVTGRIIPVPLVDAHEAAELGMMPEPLPERKAPEGPGLITSTSKGGAVLTLVSGRGGVGKTAIVALMGALAGAWGMSVALVDLDLSCGNLASYLPCAMGSDLASLVGVAKADFPGAVARLGVACSEGMRLWGPCGQPELAETVMPIVADLIACLRTSHDLVIIDTPTTCTDGVAQAMQEADRLVCVHGQGGAAIASLARTSKLAVRLGVARTRIVRVENLCEPRAWGRPFEPRVEMGLETARAFRVVEATPDVVETMAAGDTASLVALDEDFGRSVATLLASLLQELGCLPEVAEAQRAASGAFVRKTFSLFNRRREAV